MKQVKEMEKLERGLADDVIDDNTKIVFMRLKDNKMVNVISSKYGLNPTAKTKRVHQEKERLSRYVAISTHQKMQ